MLTYGSYNHKFTQENDFVRFFVLPPPIPIRASTILGKQDTMWFFNLMTASRTLVALTLDQFDMLLGFKSSCQHGRTQLSNSSCSHFIQKTQVFLAFQNSAAYLTGSRNRSMRKEVIIKPKYTLLRFLLQRSSYPVKMHGTMAQQGQRSWHGVGAWGIRTHCLRFVNAASRKLRMPAS